MLQRIKSAPNQFYILVLLLALYCSPLPLIFSSDDQRFLLLINIGLQAVFVMACNKLTKDSWVFILYLIEAVCMVWNALLFYFWEQADTVYFDAFGYFMLMAFLLEILTIHLSMCGGSDERRHADKYPKRPDSNLLCRLNFLRSMGSSIAREKVAQ